MHLLKGKRILITGGTSGIGKEIALKFAKHGAFVSVFGTNEQRLQEVLQQLEGVRQFEDQIFHGELVNVSDKAATEGAIGRLVELWGQLDVLVNNAGITRDNLLMRMKEEEWDQVIDINLKSVFNTCQTVIRPMLKARKGRIINISSVVGLTGNPGQSNYAASKSGMIGFTKALAKEVASRGIFVNCIAPGFIDTPMTQVLTDAQREVILKSIPLGRMGEVEDVADAALFFASDLSRYITGQVLTVDGGMVM